MRYRVGKSKLSGWGLGHTATGQASSRPLTEAPDDGLRRRRPSVPATPAENIASRNTIPHGQERTSAGSTQFVFQGERALPSILHHPAPSGLPATGTNFQYHSLPPPTYTDNDPARVPQIPLPLSRSDTMRVPQLPLPSPFPPRPSVEDEDEDEDEEWADYFEAALREEEAVRRRRD